MRERRVIYDSEEEDEGLSPLNSPAKTDAAHVVTTVEDDKEEAGVGHQIGDSTSTDPDLFKRIYEEQQKPVQASVPDSRRDIEAQNVSSDKLKSLDSRAKNNSSSITDPTLKSLKKTTRAKIDTEVFENTTQVTTPSAPSAKQRDVYDFSLSDEEGAPARPVSKTGRGQHANLAPAVATAMSSPPLLSTSNQIPQDQDEESPRPRRTKRNKAREQISRQTPEDVDLLVIPPTANMSGPPDETSVSHHGLGLGSVVHDTYESHMASHGCPPASFFIDPPDLLTSSQKQEYLRISGYSELEREEDNQPASLPVPRTAQAQAQGQRSTDTSVSTIAYTTPSRFASSIAPLPILETFDDRSSNVATSSGGRTEVEKTHPHSSPDELHADSTARKTRGKRLMSAVEEEDELAQHDSWNFGKSGSRTGASISRPSPQRTGTNQSSVRETKAEAETSTVRKKRQKRGGRVEPAHEDPWDSDKVGYQREHYAPRPRKRRSRVIVEEKEELQYLEQSMPDTCPPGDASHGRTDAAEPTITSPGQRTPDPATEGLEGIDPDFWAAMPNDIRQELMSQQQSTRTSQASRTRRSGQAGESRNSLVPIQEVPPQPKKRGRKKKQQNSEEAPATFCDTAAVSEEPEARPSPAPTAKRKRGRPRKAEVAPPPPPSEIEDTAPVREATELVLEAVEVPNVTHGLPDEPSQGVVEALKAPVKRGGKKKAAEASAVLSSELKETACIEREGFDPVGSMDRLAVEPSHSPVDTLAVSFEFEDRQALQDISNKASNMLPNSGPAVDQTTEKTATYEVEQQEEVTPEPKVKEVPKSTPTPGQQGKVPLRVGLSKKSRIAPLLKVIRK